MTWSMQWEISVHNMSLPFDHTCCLDKSELETLSAFSRVRKPQSKATIGVALSLSSSSNSSIRCCPPTPRPSTQAAHQLLQTACPESSCSCFSLLVGFFAASKGSSSSSFPISTSARDSLTGTMSSRMGATARPRVFVGLASALLCHPRFPSIDHCSHRWSLWISLLGSGRN